MTAAGVSKLIFCFDGASNPAKEGTNTARTAKRNRILDEIQAFYTSGNHADWPQVKKLMQSAMYPRSDIILELVSWLKEKGYEVVGAPFEADWQLIQLEKEGRTDASLTVDSDLFVVGSKLLILDFALNRSNPGISKAIIVARQTALLKMYKLIFGDEDALDMKTALGDSGMVVLASFLGNDYLPRVSGCGPVKARQMTAQWFTSSSDTQRNLLLNSMNGKQFNGNQGTVTDYAAKFYTCMNMFEYTPCILVTGAMVDLS
eukprot:CAMPEP_0174957564 /NCGR_PEP_ID=MMETSP0004_2-20121128/2140_1 /TAXON_ID=420556 /ORGANISM="Ochromonas sp., Strain CCMP1393" /LENGTH=259 /DNA_ID=CAMNT_0016205683 /DNA_START=364 /DNA_END=1143 /DNA_ORIENTATION=+